MSVLGLEALTAARRFPQESLPIHRTDPQPNFAPASHRSPLIVSIIALATMYLVFP